MMVMAMVLLMMMPKMMLDRILSDLIEISKEPHSVGDTAHHDEKVGGDDAFC